MPKAVPHAASAALAAVSTAAALAGAVLLIAGASGRTADWPEWRGPERTGASPARGLPVQ